MQQIYEAKVITLTRGDLADGIIFSRKRCILFTIKNRQKYLINGRAIHTILKLLAQFLKFASFHF